MPKHGQKSLRNQPEIYKEVKQAVSVGLTKTSIQKLGSLTEKTGISRSELVEQLVRQLVEEVNTGSHPSAVKTTIDTEDPVIRLYCALLLRCNSQDPSEALPHPN